MNSLPKGESTMTIPPKLIGFNKTLLGCLAANSW